MELFVAMCHSFISIIFKLLSASRLKENISKRFFSFTFSCITLLYVMCVYVFVCLCVWFFFCGYKDDMACMWKAEDILCVLSLNLHFDTCSFQQYWSPARCLKVSGDVTVITFQLSPHRHTGITDACTQCSAPIWVLENPPSS